eukprot:CAMPEP_0170472554 /NCGR_PEP_ID=MMETSP0123-20130129/14582_1 /TAXON_ID=182087 /ORGANISM="Favella ehrenbergii, Strain Fehren 1" /LENGTH=115 /DNA_ID=CAMNT_0010740935 /DNA_START=1546 /DNA_END=1893 /DNA_ORIENTATION=+
MSEVGDVGWPEEHREGSENLRLLFLTLISLHLGQGLDIVLPPLFETLVNVVLCRQKQVQIEHEEADEDDLKHDSKDVNLVLARSHGHVEVNVATRHLLPVKFYASQHVEHGFSNE